MVSLPSWLQSKPSTPTASTWTHETDEAGPSQPPATSAPPSAVSSSSLPTEDPASEATENMRTFDQSQIDFFRHGPSYAIPMTGASVAFVAGFYAAAKRAGLVFMAENAHRRPDTVQGWYFYNKTKNYKVMFGGVKGGVKLGLRMGLWTLTYVGIEKGMEAARYTYLGSDDQEDAAWWNGPWLDGAAAGLGIASAASILYRLPAPVTRQGLLMGTVAGGMVGALRRVQAILADRRLQELQQAKGST